MEDRMKDYAILKNIKRFDKRISSLEKEIGSMSKILMKMQKAEQLPLFRAKTEQLAEQKEQTLTTSKLNAIRGKHREVLSLLMNEGFHTYLQLAKKLNISQSRARAYIAELKNNFDIPLKQLRDPEGYKIGIDISFLDKILASR